MQADKGECHRGVVSVGNYCHSSYFHVQLHLHLQALHLHIQLHLHAGKQKGMSLRGG